MIDFSQPYFPQNAVNMLAVALAGLDPKIKVHKRPLRTTDSALCASVVAVNWSPDEDSLELRRPAEPTVSRYTLGVQGMAKDMSEERGIAKHSALSVAIRHLLYRDPVLAEALSRLDVPVAGGREVFLRSGIAGQEFMSNEAPRGGFLYLSTVEFWFETQIK